MVKKKKVISETLTEKMSLEEAIVEHLRGMGRMLLSPYPNPDQYNRAIGHLRDMLKPYADAKYKKEEKEIEFNYQKELRKPRGKKNARGLSMWFYSRMFQELNDLIRRLDIGLGTEDKESIIEEEEQK